MAVPRSETEFLIGKRLDIVEYSVGEAQKRAGMGNPFPSRVLGEPKTWIYGGPEAFRTSEAA